MAIASLDIDTSSTARGALGGQPFTYHAFDLCVRSDVSLPLAAEVSDLPATPHVVIRRIDSHPPPVPDGPAVITLRCPVHGSDMIEHRGPGGTWIWLRSVGTFHISPSARLVDVYPDIGVDERVLELALFGPVLLFVRHRLGSPTLHASAVVVRHRTVAFLGMRGQGKSTMAASFLHRGAKLFSDDALPLSVRGDDVTIVPGPPYIKLWREALEQTLELHDALPNLMAYVEKKLLALEGRYPWSEQPTPVHALYLLDRYDPVERGHSTIAIRTLNRRESLFALLAHTYSRPFARPADDAQSLPVYTRLVTQTPVRVLSYPHGFVHQDRVHAHILQDLGVS